MVNFIVNLLIKNEENLKAAQQATTKEAIEALFDLTQVKERWD